MLTLLLSSLFTYTLEPLEGLTEESVNFFVIGDFSALVEVSGKLFAADGFGLAELEPEDLSSLKRLPTPDYSTQIAAAGNSVYLAGSKVTEFNLSAGTPETLASYPLEGKATALAVAGDFVAVGTDSARLVIFSRSPEGLKRITTLQLAEVPGDLASYRDVLYVACGRGGLEVIRVSGEPTRLSPVSLSGVQALAVGEGKLYAATDYSTMTVYSLTDAARPDEIKSFPTQSPAVSLAYYNKHIYAAQGYQGYTVFSAQGRPLEDAEPVREGFIAQALPTSGGLYLAAGDKGVFRLQGPKPQALKVSGRLYQSSPVQHTSASGSFWGVAQGKNVAQAVMLGNDEATASLAAPPPMNAVGAEISGTNLYVADSGRGVSVFSIKDFPRIERKFDLFVPGIPMRFAFTQDQILVAAGPRGLRVLWICPCGPLKERASMDDGVYAVDVAGKDSVAYVADPDSGLRIVLMRPQGKEGLNLEQVSIYPGAISPVALLREGDTLYVADSVGAVAVLDISDPLSLRQIAFIPLATRPYGMAKEGSTLYVAAGEEGVLTIDLADPQAPTLMEPIQTPGKALAVDVSGGYLGVADFTSWMLAALE